MGNILPVNAVVIRFAPNSPNGILKRAMTASRQSGYFRVSVFASPPLPGESEGSTIARLLDASELGGISTTNNEKYYLCASAGAIERLGFIFVKDDYAGEIREHFSVDFGREPSLEDAQQLSDTFTIRKRAS
ncbi:hypothetical protein ACX80D_09810 [Arthrobacter sp. Sr24]